MAILRRVIDAPRDALILLVRGYRFFLSPWLGSSCRFEPTCSAYSLQALGRHGAVAGSWLTVARLARCNPWCEGGHDPVPDQAFPLFSRLLGAVPNRPTRSYLSREKNTP
jgi:putative membrane protein insertion efficiency factor